jgi:hypothetical protein
MPRKTQQDKLNLTSRTTYILGVRYLKRRLNGYWQENIWHKLNIGILILVLTVLGVMYATSHWYRWSNRSHPIEIGTTFVPNYARYFELDPKATLRAIFDELGIKRIRLVSYWSTHEKERGKYDFSELDWQMDMAADRGAKVSLAIGLRQPRWPECHPPEWAKSLPRSEWQPELMKYLQATVERYRDHPALDSYQLENEYFLKVFGICPDHSRDRLEAEYALVKSLDQKHPVYVSRSNNALGMPVYGPQADKSAVSVYKRVWDKNLTKRYFEYPLPAWFYGWLAGVYKIYSGKETFIHELQAEPWMPEGFDMKTSTIEEQDKSMDAARLRTRFEYGRATGMKQIDLWGAEWWYWRKVHHNDPSLWEAAKEEIQLTSEINKHGD